MTNEMFFSNIDAIIERLKMLPRSPLRVLNVRRCMQLKAAYNALSGSVTEADDTLRCEFHPEMGYACIHLRAASLLWDRNQRFPEELLLADNFEIYAVDDTMLQMDVMFYGVTTALRGDN